MADADLTYDFDEIPRFVAALEAGADMVIGNRMKNIHPGAMPWHHRYIGNPLLSGFLNLLFHTGVDDAHCGMRALRSDVLPRLDLRTTGMEFASEMVIRAAKEKLDVRQFAIEYHPRGGESKLSSFRDGWRHLRFLLVHSPNHLFILPGAVMAVLGAVVQLIVIARLPLFGREWDIHAMIAGALLMIVGTQVVGLGICAHAYATYFMNERDRWFDRMRARFNLEHGLLLGGGIALTGFVAARLHRDRLDQPRLRGAGGGAPGRARRLADHRRDPDLLLVVFDLDPRTASGPGDSARGGRLGQGALVGAEGPASRPLPGEAGGARRSPRADRRIGQRRPNRVRGRGRRVRIEVQRHLAADLAQHRNVRGGDRRAALHRLDHRDAEPLRQRREHDARRKAVQGLELGVRDVIDKPHTIGDALLGGDRAQAAS